MSDKTHGNMAFFTSKRIKGLPPQRTVKELAAEFGVTVDVLSQALGTPGAPKHNSQSHGNGLNRSNTYFNPAEVRKWWKARQCK